VTSVGEGGTNAVEEVDDASPDRQRAPKISPRLSLLLIGGVALGGIACMCAGVLALAIWQAT
jgi:hypothetical protein